jgi:hypothetical protein
MPIYWKALEDHFLMVPLVFQFNHFRGKMHFLNFSPKARPYRDNFAASIRFGKDYLPDLWDISYYQYKIHL